MIGATSFLRAGAFVCLGTAVVQTGEALFPQDGRVADIIGDVLSVVCVYALVGFAWGLTAISQTRWARVAAGALLIQAVTPAIAILAGRHDIIWHIVLAASAIGNASLAVALAHQTSRRVLALALLTAASAVGASIAGWLNLPQFRTAGIVAAALGLAALFFVRARRPPESSRAQSTIDAWRRAGEGARLIVRAERGRFILLAITFALGALSIGIKLDRWRDIIATLGNVAVVLVSALGIVAMRHAPFGRAWATGALAFSLMAVGAGLVEVAAIAAPLIGIRLDPDAVGLMYLIRLFGQHAVPAFAALTLAALGQRAEVADAEYEGRHTAWLYLGLFAALLAASLTNELGGPKLLATVLGIASIIVLISAVNQLGALGDLVRAKTAAGAAADVFGDAETTEITSPR